MPSPTRPIRYIEIDTDRCNNTFGSSPCTATGEPCFQTWKGCKDKDNYVDGDPLTIRLAEPTQEVEFQTYTIPIVKSVGISSSRVNIGGESFIGGPLGLREEVDITILDAPHDDNLVDPYVHLRSYNPLDHGGFGGKLIARNFLEGREVRIIDGFYGMPEEDMRVSHYIINKVTPPGANDTFTLRLSDLLALALDDKAQFPTASQGQLITPIAKSGSVSQIHLDVVALDFYPPTGHVTIGSEVFRYVGVDDNKLINVSRARFNTVAAEHNVNDTVQFSPYFNGSRPVDVIRSILLGGTNIQEEMLDYDAWVEESEVWGLTQEVTRLITRPFGVTELIGQITQQFGMFIWADNRARKIKLKYSRPPWFGEKVWDITEDDHLLQGTTRLKSYPQERLSQVWVSYRQFDPTSDPNSRESYTRHRLHVDTAAQSVREYGEARITEITSPWLTNEIDGMSLAFRTLDRSRTTPVYVTFQLAGKDADIAIGDVINLTWRGIVDERGFAKTSVFQVISISEIEVNSKIEVEARNFEFTHRYAGICPNDYPDYNSATDEQKHLGAFISDGDNDFDDGEPPYRII